MSKEKLEKLNTYLKKMKSRLEDGVPEKHRSHPKQYIDFMNREIRLVQSQLDDAKLEMGAGK
jgi:flagellar biosynthesis chaperone FliJ